MKKRGKMPVPKSKMPKPRVKASRSDAQYLGIKRRNKSKPC